ncbi:MAG: RNA methyltransferase [Pseudomonadota bacterium]
MNSLDSIRFVLDHTSHPGNIGATARAMKVMGINDLRLVAPLKFPHADATALASSADDLLDRAQVFDTLDQAIADCTLVVGCSGKARTISQDQVDPRNGVQRIFEASGPVAVVFGCERSGLDNTAQDRCHYLMSIPTVEAYTSLNLAQAVQVIAYELRQAAIEHQHVPGVVSPVSDPPASAARLDVFFRRFEDTLDLIDYGGSRPRHTLYRRIRQLFLRAQPTDDELNLYNGILSKTQRLAKLDRAQ